MMRRLTVYLDDALYSAIVRHAEHRGQKLSTFISRELAHLAGVTPEEMQGAVEREQTRQRRFSQ